MPRQTHIRKRTGRGRKKPRRKSHLWPGYLAALVAVSIACFSTGAAQRVFTPPETYHEGVVARIVDGDTFYIDGVETRIRLWGLDAPEKGDRGGNRATRMLREIAHGQHVSCREVEKDRYGRIVGQCFLSDGGDVAALMIESGAASEYLRYSGGYYSRTAVASSD